MLLLFIINLLHITFNIYKYILGLQIFRILILIFYLFISVSTVCRIIEYICRTINPQESYFGGHLKIEKVSQYGALFCVVGVGITLIVTMYQLTLSL